MQYEFAGCRLDEDARSLECDGQPCHVQPKVFDLILFMLQHRPRVVPRGVLQRALWPDVVVSESALNRIVKEARRAIGDDGRDQQIIRTLHGRGYRFVAEVSMSGADAAGEPLRSLELARLSLESAIDLGVQDMRDCIRDFVSVCEDVVRRSNAPNPGGERLDDVA